MKIKRILIIITLALVLVNLPLLALVYKKFTQDIVTANSSGIYIIMAVSVGFLLIGQWLRMLRTKTIIDQVRVGGNRGQFAALAVGYFFNAMLPLRIGEFFRSYLISSRLQISFLYTFVAVVIERSIDVIFICLVALLIAINVSSATTITILFSALIGLSIAIGILSVLWLLTKENKKLLTIIWLITSLFNKNIQNSYRFKIWSLIYGLQRFIANKKALLKYVIFAILSWVSLLISTGIIAVYYFSDNSIFKIGVLTSEPYIAVTSLVGSLGIESYVDSATDILNDTVSSSPSSLSQYLLTVWFVLVIPMAIIGLISIFIFDWKHKKQIEHTVDTETFTNKLSRKSDLSQDFPVFLDSYFKGDNLSRILHKIEIEGKVSLVKFFKGGSDAVTILVLHDGELVVKKIIPLEYEDRLRAQYLWLQKYNKLRYLVKVKGEKRSNNYYSIDLEYNSENIPFFEFLHQKHLDDSMAVLDHVWAYLYDNIHKDAKKANYYPKIRDQYIKKHIYSCVEKAEKVDDELRMVRSFDKIKINGREYDNLDVIMAKIKSNKHAWRDIATYRRGDVVHGDMAIDNILVSPTSHQPLIIDPAPDGNLIEGPVFDLGKLSQSFYCGYEFLLRDDSPTHVKGNNEINYTEQRTTQYEKIWLHLRYELAPKYVGEAEQKALLFHAATLHLRRLKHQVNYNSENVIKFYAVGVKTLNDFLNQYK